MMVTREQQRNKYETDKRYHSDPDNLDQSSSNRYSLRNNFGLFFEFRKQTEITKLLNKYKISLKNKKILDIGCHRGLHCNFFAQLKGTSKGIYGVDFISSFIKQAKEINPRIIFKQCDIYWGLPFKDGFFDIIFAIYFYNCIPKEEQKKISMSISKKVKSKGYIILFEFLDSPYARLAQKIAHINKEFTRLPSLNDNIVNKLFPDFQIIESKKIINILSYRISKVSYSLASLLDNFLPKEFYITLIQKK